METFKVFVPGVAFSFAGCHIRLVISCTESKRPEWNTLTLLSYSKINRLDIKKSYMTSEEQLWTPLESYQDRFSNFLNQESCTLHYRISICVMTVHS